MGVEPQTARRRPQHLGNLVIGVSPIARAIKGQEPVEFFHNVNIDFLGKKWYFLAFSLIFSVAGVLSMLFWHGIPWGVEFRGGTLVYVKFTHTPDLGQKETNEQALEQGRNTIINALQKNVPAGKQDLNNASVLTVKNYLRDKDPLAVGGDEKKYTEQAQAIINYRNSAGGVLTSMDQLKASGADPAAVASLSDGFFL